MDNLVEVQQSTNSSNEEIEIIKRPIIIDLGRFNYFFRKRLTSN